MMVYIVPPSTRDNGAFCLLGYNVALSIESQRTTWYYITKGVFLCNHCCENFLYSLSENNKVFLVYKKVIRIMAGA